MLCKSTVQKAQTMRAIDATIKSAAIVPNIVMMQTSTKFFGSWQKMPTTEKFKAKFDSN